MVTLGRPARRWRATASAAGAASMQWRCPTRRATSGDHRPLPQPASKPMAWGGSDLPGKHGEILAEHPHHLVVGARRSGRNAPIRRRNPAPWRGRYSRDCCSSPGTIEEKRRCLPLAIRSRSSSRCTTAARRSAGPSRARCAKATRRTRSWWWTTPRATTRRPWWRRLGDQAHPACCGMSAIRVPPPRAIPASRRRWANGSRCSTATMNGSRRNWHGNSPRCTRRPMRRRRASLATSSATIAPARSGLSRQARPMRRLDALVWGCPLGVGSTLLARRAVFAEIGAFDPDLPRLEDWEWLLRYLPAHRLGVVAGPADHRA